MFNKFENKQRKIQFVFILYFFDLTKNIIRHLNQTAALNFLNKCITNGDVKTMRYENFYW